MGSHPRAKVGSPAIRHLAVETNLKLLCRRRPLLRFVSVLALAICWSAASHAYAQAPYELISMSSSWKYAQPTQSLGSHWRDPSYDDSMWAAGQGVLAVENSSNS